jgi:hypothetical protein
VGAGREPKRNCSSSSIDSTLESSEADAAEEAGAAVRDAAGPLVGAERLLEALFARRVPEARTEPQVELEPLAGRQDAEHRQLGDLRRKVHAVVVVVAQIVVREIDEVFLPANGAGVDVARLQGDEVVEPHADVHAVAIVAVAPVVIVIVAPPALVVVVAAAIHLHADVRVVAASADVQPAPAGRCALGVRARGEQEGRDATGRETDGYRVTRFHGMTSCTSDRLAGRPAHL